MQELDEEKPKKHLPAAAAGGKKKNSWKKGRTIQVKCPLLIECYLVSGNVPCICNSLSLSLIITYVYCNSLLPNIINFQSSLFCTI